MYEHSGISNRAYGHSSHPHLTVVQGVFLQAIPSFSSHVAAVKEYELFEQVLVCVRWSALSVKKSIYTALYGKDEITEHTSVGSSPQLWTTNFAKSSPLSAAAMTTNAPHISTMQEQDSTQRAR